MSKFKGYEIGDRVIAVARAFAIGIGDTGTVTGRGEPETDYKTGKPIEYIEVEVDKLGKIQTPITTWKVTKRNSPAVQADETTAYREFYEFVVSIDGIAELAEGLKADDDLEGWAEFSALVDRIREMRGEG